MVITQEKVVLLLIVVAAVAGALLLDRLVVTESERVEKVIEEMAAAVERADADGILARVSGNYAGADMPVGALRELAEAFFEQHGQLSVTLSDVRVEVAGTLATAQVAVRVYSQGSESYGRSRWEIDLLKEPDGEWGVIRITPVQLEEVEIADWGDLRRYGGF